MGCTTCGGKVISGIIGITKALIGVGQVDEATLKFRRNQCRDCDRATRNPDPKFAAFKGITTLSRCSVCECFLKAKTSLADESCPLPDPKWVAATVGGNVSK